MAQNGRSIFSFEGPSTRDLKMRFPCLSYHILYGSVCPRPNSTWSSKYSCIRGLLVYLWPTKWHSLYGNAFPIIWTLGVLELGILGTEFALSLQVSVIHWMRLVVSRLTSWMYGPFTSIWHLLSSSRKRVTPQPAYKSIFFLRLFFLVQSKARVFIMLPRNLLVKTNIHDRGKKIIWVGTLRGRLTNLRLVRCQNLGSLSDVADYWLVDRYSYKMQVVYARRLICSLI